MSSTLKTITVEQHLQRVLRWLPITRTESVSLDEAVDRTTAKEITASLDLPPWDNAAMDGYAVRVADTVEATPDQPVTLRVIGSIGAGARAHRQLSSGEALAITTGAPVPETATSVVPIEDVVGFDPAQPTAGAKTPEHIQLTAPPADGKHIRRRAEDVYAGESVLAAGIRMSAHHVGAVAAAGVAEVPVKARPKVAVIATGEELVDPGSPLAHGQIPDSNSYLVAAQVRAAGGDVVLRTHVGDDPNELRRVLAETADHSDAVVLTGGASVGAHDVSRLVLAPDAPAGYSVDDERGDHRLHDAAVQFVRVQMQPGKPQGFGVLDDGRPVWVLPGNPVSALVSTVLFVCPGLAAMQGRVMTTPAWRAVTTATGWVPPGGRTQYLPVRSVGPDDELFPAGRSEGEVISPAHERGSGSHLAARLGLATGLVRIPAAVESVSAGDTVMYRELGGA